MDQITKELRHPRNLQLHRGHDPDLGILQIHEMLSLLQMEGCPMMEVKKLDELYKLARQVILDELIDQTKTILETVSSLFEAMFSQYDLQSRINQLGIKV